MNNWIDEEMKERLRFGTYALFWCYFLILLLFLIAYSVNKCQERTNYSEKIGKGTTCTMNTSTDSKGKKISKPPGKNGKHVKENVQPLK